MFKMTNMNDLEKVNLVVQNQLNRLPKPVFLEIVP